MRITMMLMMAGALSACGGGDAANVTAPASSVAGVAPAAGEDWSLTVAQTPENGYRMGNPNAQLKLVEYGSRLCPGCQRFYAEGNTPLVENYVKTGKISYEFRDFPVHGAVDIPSILLGHCVAKEAFFPILDQMFENQPAFLEKQSKLSQERYGQLQRDPVALADWLATEMGYLDFVEQRGVPAATAKQCLSDRASIDRIGADMEAAVKLGVGGTPTFFLNGTRIDGGDWRGVEAALKRAGA